MADKGKRRYRFTLNNYTDEDMQQLEQFTCTYMVYGYEIAPTTGTPHLQGYFEMKDNKTMSAVCKKIKRISLKECDATPAENREYCIKDGKFTERGTINCGQGKRTDLESVKERVKSGTLLMRDVVLETSNLQTIRHAEIVLKYHEQQRHFKPHVSWYFGKAGSGKTQQAEIDLGEGYYPAMDNLKWWEGYDGHENVLIDEFRENKLPYDQLLRLLDRYPYRVETKGASRQFLAKKIIITSQYHPSTMYRTLGEDMAQLLRRIDVIKCFGAIQETEIDEFNELN